MLCKLIRAELMKLRRSPVWLAFIVMPVIPALMGTFNYLENLELLHSEWYSLWTQHTLFTDYIFLPPAHRHLLLVHDVYRAEEP